MSKFKFATPRGTNDILPIEVPIWQGLEKKARDILKIYNYKEIRTPIFEDTELFARSMGQSSDVVQKQMLNLASQKANIEEQKDLSGLSLRPENTASVVRSYIQNSLDKKEHLSKLFYLGPMFRGERPQKGRLRQFHQLGVEVIGPDSSLPHLDAEVIALSVNILKKLGVKDFILRINTLGSAKDKESFSKLLRKQIEPYLPELSEALQDSFRQNVFRILDSKDKKCREIVQKIDINHSYLSKESQDYFQEVQKALDSLEIQYEVDLKLVRGLDYYTHTVFEISNASLGSQDALGAGGRYGNLVSQLGGPEVDAIGFALGVERILLVLAQDAIEIDEGLTAFIIAMDKPAFVKAFQLLKVLRDHGISSELDHRISSMKSQMRQANKAKAKFAIIIGEEELKTDCITLKDMTQSKEEKVSIRDRDYKKLIEKLK